MKFDFHLHSLKSFDNPHGPTIEQILMRIADEGLQGCAITDHDRGFDANQFSSLELAYDLVLISGIEITHENGHLVALGISEEISTHLPLEEIISKIHQSNGIVIAAHPFDPNYGIENLVYDLEIDAIELNGRRENWMNSRAKEAAQALNLPTVGGSDAHKIDDIGTAFTSFETPIQNSLDIINAIKQKHCKGIIRQF